MRSLLYPRHVERMVLVVSLSSFFNKEKKNIAFSTVQNIVRQSSAPRILCSDNYFESFQEGPSSVLRCPCMSTRQQVQTKRQDKLLFVGLHVLINLAEEVSTERKMVRKYRRKKTTAMGVLFFPVVVHGVPPVAALWCPTCYIRNRASASLPAGYIVTVVLH